MVNTGAVDPETEHARVPADPRRDTRLSTPLTEPLASESVAHPRMGRRAKGVFDESHSTIAEHGQSVGTTSFDAA